MNLKVIVETVIYAFILMSSIIYSWHKLSNKRIDFTSRRLYITLIGMMMTSIFNFFIVNRFVRIILITMLFMLFYKFLFRDTIQKCVLTPIYSQILIFFVELLFVIVVMSIIDSPDTKFMSTSFMTMITNIAISALLYAVVHIPIINRIYIKFISLTDNIGSKQLVIFCLIGMLILNIFIISSYYKIRYEYFVVINVILITSALSLIIYSFKTQNKYNKVSDQYNVAKTSLLDYEAMMTKYRVANHENKNLLLTVRAMAINKENNIPEYIDSIIEDKFEDDERLLFEMGVIPTGGLRATIYSEILKIKENKINYNLNIDRKISTIDLIELDTNTIIDICKVLGVFIDNSIEAVKRLKQKYINIDMYIIDEKLYIKVSNNFRGAIDISRIYEEGYTTKSKGHGYGLPLVKEIINNNDYIENETDINKKVFNQILKIRYKKNH